MVLLNEQYSVVCICMCVDMCACMYALMCVLWSTCGANTTILGGGLGLSPLWRESIFALYHRICQGSWPPSIQSHCVLSHGEITDVI